MSYSFGNLKIYPFNEIIFHEFKIEKKIGEHSRAIFSGMINKENAERYPYIGDDEIIEIYLGSEAVFVGYVEKIGVRHIAQDHYIDVTAVSLSVNMDIEKKIRTFQDKTMKYEDILKTIATENGFEIFIDKEIKGAIEFPIIQYMESDWEFIKRVVSRFKKEIVIDARNNAIYAGSSERGVSKVSNPVFKIEKDIKRYRDIVNNSDPEITGENYISYTLQSREVFEAGDIVSFNNRVFEIRSCYMAAIGSAILTDYKLYTPGKYIVPRIRNRKIAGKSFNCEVLKAEGNKLKLLLKDLMDVKDEAKAYLFPYSTPYSSEGNTGIYIMPEIGDNVLLTFPTEEESDSIVTGSIRIENKEGDKHSDPEVKYIRTKNGREIMIDKTTIKLSATDGKIHIRLIDDAGISIYSEKDILLQSKGDMNISSGGYMRLESHKDITIVSKGAITNMTQAGYEIKAGVNKNN